MKTLIHSLIGRRALFTSAIAMVLSSGCSAGGEDSGRDEPAAPAAVEEPLSASNAQVHGATQGTRNWRADLLGTVEGPAAVGTNGSIYVGTDQGFVAALEPSTGASLWDVFVRGVVLSSPTVGRDGTLYVATDASGLHAIDPTSHFVLWSFDAGSVVTSPVLAHDGTIYLGNQAGRFFAVNPNGTQKWTFLTGGAIASTAAVGPDGTVYFGSNDNSVYALNPQGTQKWKRTLANDVRSTPALGGNTVYVASDANKLHALDAATGAVRWDRDAAVSGVRSSPVVGPNGNVFIGTTTSRVIAFTPQGATAWTYVMGGSVNGTPVIDVDGRLYVGAKDKKLYAINASTGTLIFSYLAPSAVLSPSLDPDGRVVFGTSDGLLTSVGLGKGIVRGNDTTVSAGQPLANFGFDEQLKIGREAGTERRTVVGFSVPKLAASVEKNVQLASAQIVLKKQLGSAASTTPVSAHLMNRGWTEDGATWGCANDRDRSATAAQCDAADVWSMTSTAQLPYNPTATTTAVLGSGTQITFDVTADVRQRLLEGIDSDDISWLLRSSGTDLVTLGSAQSATPPELVLTFQPIDPQVARDAKIQDAVTNRVDPVNDAAGAWIAWAAICEAWRAMHGLSSDPLYVSLVEDLTSEQRADIEALFADIQSIPSNLAAGALGPFAGLDPRACTGQPAFETMFEIFGAMDMRDVATLRAPFCSETNDDITVGADLIEAPAAVPDGPPIPGRTAATARPVITGVDPTLYVPSDSTPAVFSEFGHPTLVDDWRLRRGGNTTHTPGDGLSPFGVKTNISCTGTNLQNDTCDHTAGLMCDTLGFTKATPEGKCLAFPIVFQQEGIRLLGYNFWDSNAPLFIQDLSDPTNNDLLERDDIQVHKNAIASINCTAGLNLLTSPSLEAAGVGNQNSITYPIDRHTGFFRLRMYNRNGQFFTQADKLNQRAEGRTIHVCRSAVETGGPDAWEQRSEGTRLGCVPPAETCLQDGAPCSGQWSPLPPRSLAECRNSAAHAPGSGIPDECGETPVFFPSDGPSVIVYISPQRPTYTYRTFIDRVECANETGCDHCGGEDEFRMRMFSTTERALNNIGKDPKAFRDQANKVYHGEFNHGEIRHPERLLQEIREVRRSDKIISFVQFYEDDSETRSRTLGWGIPIVGGAAAVASYYGGAGAGEAVTAVGGAIMTWIILGSKSDDIIGSTGWEGTYWQVQERVAYTHHPDFLVTERASPHALPTLPGGVFGSKGRFDSDLLHPIVGYGRKLADIVPECSSVTAGHPLCQANTTCYINQCIGTSERDGRGGMTWPNGFTNPATDDFLFGIGYRARYQFAGSDGRYRGDFEFVLCPTGSTSPRCTAPPPQ
jgi:outer membrane protein assembly factor BamB